MPPATAWACIVHCTLHELSWQQLAHSPPCLRGRTLLGGTQALL
eukprot:COSAG06_NODE_2051_length_7730_cov_3.256582_5_plen_44_part_00